MMLEDVLWKKRAKKEMRMNLAIGITIGTFIGILMGILLTPKTGREIRKDIKNRIREFKDRDMIEIDITKDGL